MGNVVIQPLGTPRVLVSDAATLNRYRALINGQAAAAVRFKSLVDAEVAGSRAYDFKPWYAALMGKITGVANYCTFAVSRTETFVASEEALINANQRATVAGDSYLEVGPVIGNVALVYDWCRDSMTAAQRTRWANYANQAVWNVWNHNQARWGSTTYAWSGWSVDNPANNYYYSFLEATMLLGLATYGENPQAQGWIEKFRNEKIANQLMVVFNRDLVGGGSREGTGYGTAMKNLWRLYDWWERSTGERIATMTPHTLASMTHLMHQITPTLDRLAPTGDHARDSTATLFDYHRDYLQELIRLFPGDRQAGIAKTLLANSSVPRMANSFMYYSDFLYDHSDVAARPLADLSTAYWGSGTGQFAMRSAWTRDAAFANFICGPYSESHAHHDQGSFVVFKGNWLAYDSNVASASGIEQAESLHNLVRIEQNGSVITQREGAPQCQMLALAENANYAYGVARVTPIYGGKAGVVKVEREFLFLKPGTFVVFDRVQSSGTGMRRVWTMNTPVTPTVNGDAFSIVNGANRLDVTRLSPSGLSTQVVPWAGASGVRSGSRVDVADSTGDASAFLHVLGTDGSVLSSARSDASGQTGAQVAMSNGRTATVRFNATGTGGTLEIRDASGAVLSTGALPTTVQAPALFVN